MRREFVIAHLGRRFRVQLGDVPDGCADILRAVAALLARLETPAPLVEAAE